MQGLAQIRGQSYSHIHADAQDTVMSKTSSSYRPDIDGLRGIAVFCVVVFHAGFTRFSGGFVGVDIFFVISGYLIASIIQREIDEQRFSYARFYARRAKRILPALLVMLMASITLATLVMTGAEMNDFARSAVANAGAVSNVYFWKSANYFSTSAELKPLMMTWSLSVEEQFYLFFPPVLLILHRVKWRPWSTLLVLSVISLAASVWMTPRNPSNAFFLLPTRAWELGVGALLAQNSSRVTIDRYVPHWLRETLAAVGLLGVVYSVSCYTNATRFPGIAATVPVFGTAILIATQNSMVNRHILSNKVLVFIGLVSYSWYLWHWPMMSFARIVTPHPITLTTALTLAAASFLVAILSWSLVEQPFRTTRHSDSKTLWRYGAATIAVLAVGTLLMAGNGWQGRLPGNFVAIESSGALHPNPCLADYGKAVPALGSHCHSTVPNRTSVALIGDSHAGALGPGVRALAARNGLGYTELTKGSCPALYGVTRLMPTHPQHAQECASFNRDIAARLRDDASIKVVFITGYWSAPFLDEAGGQRFVPADRPSVSVTPEQSRQYLRQGLEATVRYLTTAGKKVVLLKDVPIFTFDPMRAVATETIPVRRMLGALLGIPPAGSGQFVSASELRNNGELANLYIDAIAKQYPQITVIDPASTLCDHGRCKYAGAGNLYYIDSQHLSEAGARVVLGEASIRELLTNEKIAAKDGPAQLPL